MEEKIKELQDYFKGKLLANEFTELGNDNYFWTVTIDKNNFTFWVANGRHGFMQTVVPDQLKLNFMVLEFTIEELAQLHKIYVTNYREDQLKIEKDLRRRQYEQLKKEFGDGKNR